MLTQSAPLIVIQPWGQRFTVSNKDMFSIGCMSHIFFVGDWVLEMRRNFSIPLESVLNSTKVNVTLTTCWSHLKSHGSSAFRCNLQNIRICIPRMFSVCGSFVSPFFAPCSMASLRMHEKAKKTYRSAVPPLHFANLGSIRRQIASNYMFRLIFQPFGID